MALLNCKNGFVSGLGSGLGRTKTDEQAFPAYPRRMLNPKNMGHAVDLQERSYRLLRWLSSAVSEGTIRFEQAHRYSTVPEAAQEWIRRNYLNLPVDAYSVD